MAVMFYVRDADVSLIKSKRVAVIGYGSQGHAHSLNLRDSGIKVVVANRRDSANGRLAVEHGFDPVSVDGWALSFALVLSVITGVLFGVVPAWQASRPELQNTLKDNTRGSTGDGQRHVARAGLVLAEVSISLVLLVVGATVAGIALQQPDEDELAQNPDDAWDGFDPDNVVVINEGDTVINNTFVLIDLDTPADYDRLRTACLHDALTNVSS